jgi:hypothetical protein
MSKSKKITLGILTFSPLIGIVLYFISFFAIFNSMEMITGEMGTIESHEDMEMMMSGVFGGMGVAFLILLLTMLVSVGMVIYYIIHIVNNKQLDQEKNEHLIWIAVTLLAGYIGQFIYWYMKIWKEEPIDNAMIES